VKQLHRVDGPAAVFIVPREGPEDARQENFTLYPSGMFYMHIHGFFLFDISSWRPGSRTGAVILGPDFVLFER
jgi:hypothetical protein